MTYDIGRRAGLLAAGLALQGVCGASVNHSGLWWNPAESGWGVAIEEQGSVVSAVMATYDAAGQPVWFILPRAEMGAAGADPAAPLTFSGAYYGTTGLPEVDTCTRCGDPPLFPPSIALTALGDAGFVFNADGTGTFMTPTSASGAKSITPEVFAEGESSVSCGDGASSAPLRYQGFWANANESGWGLYLAHQGDVVFGLWLTYAPNGSPRWYSMPLAKGEGSSYSGPIMYSTGPAFSDALYDVSLVGVMEVGSATVRFDDRNNAHLDYRLPGLYSGTRDVARQVFSESAEAACG